jgi:starch synthase (maltosyl-transferring)
MRYPVKRTVGDPVDVRATVVADGHVQVRAELRFRLVGARRWSRVPMRTTEEEPDRFGATFRVDGPGRWEYTVAAWIDAAATWRDELRRKVDAGQTDLEAELADGSALLGCEVPDPAAGLASTAEVRLAKVALGRPLVVVAEPTRAAFGAWYELFPRSFGGFDGVRAVLPEIADLGFDVVYLPPIHPIGTTNRKGRNNVLSASRADPGSPWAIGGPEGGHTAVHPELGTLDDFDRLVARAGELGLEIALDFAVQASPDHPWLQKHPEWFSWRPDGSIKYAENPPKRYQDIVNFDFDSPKAKQLWEALLGVVEHWIEHGVRMFRVDNPHTKPFAFWEWLIETVHADHPDVVFLAEAFTRPAVMATLAKLGFSQSYTYFTWRNTKAELTSYLTELTRSELPQYFRPNFFANTPDILHAYLVRGGRPAFEARLVLAATLSPSYGIYSGFERCENTPLTESSEEYLNSEKYEIKKRSLGGPLLPLIGRLNAVRRANPALQRLDNLTFLETENEHLIAYIKRSGDNAVIACVNLDPAAAHEGVVIIPPELGLPSAFDVSDLLGDATFTWRSGSNYVRLEPGLQQAHLLRVEL